MDVFDMPLKIAFVSDGVLPVFRLENTPTVITLTAGGERLFLAPRGQPSTGKAGLDPSPTSRIGVIAGRKRPDRVEMLGQQDDRVDLERTANPAFAKRRSQEVSRSRVIEDRRATVGHDGKEKDPARHEIPSVVWHPVTEPMSWLTVGPVETGRE